MSTRDTTTLTLEEAGRRRTAIETDLTDLFNARRALFEEGCRVGLGPTALAKAAKVSRQFVYDELGATPVLGTGSTEQEIEVLGQLVELTKKVQALQEEKKNLRLLIDGLIAERVKAGVNATTEALAAESGLSTATVDRVRRALKTAK